MLARTHILRACCEQQDGCDCQCQDATTNEPTAVLPPRLGDGQSGTPGLTSVEHDGWLPKLFPKLLLASLSSDFGVHSKLTLHEGSVLLRSFTAFFPLALLPDLHHALVGLLQAALLLLLPP